MANPYAAPAGALAPVDGSDMELERRDHRTHEARVRGLGVAWMVQGVVRVLGAVIPARAAWEQAESATSPGLWTTAGLMAAVGVATILSGVGVRRLQQWGWILGMLTSLVGLIYVPMGTVLSLWAMGLLLAPKGLRIFAPDYAELQAQTPDVSWEPKPIPAMIVALVMVSALVGGCIALARLGMLAA